MIGPVAEPPATNEPQPFAHLNVQNAELYRAALLVFVRAKRRFVVHLRPEDVHAELSGAAGWQAVGLDAVAAALEQLAKWRNLRQDPDTGRVVTVEDFHRARYLYQLTPFGWAAEQAIALYEENVGRRGALQSVALSDIASQLQSLAVLAGDAVASGGLPDSAKTHLLLMSVVDRFTGLADNAQAFMSSLRRAIDFADTEIEVFLAYKERLIGYLERFIADLANQGAEIAELSQRIEQIGVEPLLQVAARREAADAAPDSAAGDEFELATSEALARWRERWSGLRDWFYSAVPHRQSQAKLLRAAAIGAITQLLNTVTVINERRSGRSDRSADFRALALWFANAADDDTAHRIWRVAFGLSAARHLTVTPQTLDLWQQQPVPAATKWADAPRLEISPRLRATGSYERRGSPNRVIDRSEQRRALAERAEREAVQTGQARSRLATDREIRISELGELDQFAFRLFLRLLGDALAAKAPGQKEVVTSTGDGTMLVRLTVIEDAEPVVVRTLDGVLTGPDHWIEITDLTTGDP
jgi:uncharacterized protein (TIGR02677 family)